MSALDRLPDFGDRYDAWGQPLDEFGAVLMLLPSSDDPAIVMIAAEIARHRCHGRGDVAEALARWHPETRQ